MAYTFGVSTQYDTKTNFLMQGVTRNNTVDVAEARDESGDVAAVEAYNEREEISFDAIFGSGATLPTAGATITVSSKTYIVTSCTETESNTDYKRCSISANRYIANSIPSSSSGD